MMNWKEEILKKLELHNFLVSTISNFPFEEVKKFFPLPKGNDTKKVRKLREFLSELSSRSDCYFYLIRDPLFDTIYARKDSDGVRREIMVCCFDKQTSAFRVNENKPVDIEKVLKEMNLAERLVEFVEWIMDDIQTYEVKQYIRERLRMI